MGIKYDIPILTSPPFFILSGCTIFMSKTLRFTGKNPPHELWQKFPNWRNAFEEEGLEGQDETTLMPHEVQSHIGGHTSFTAGTVRFHDGRQFPAFLAVLANGIEGCQVYESAVPWRIYFNRQQKRWVPFRAEWLPESDRPPQVSFDNRSVFPLEINMLVPWREGDVPSVYQISSTGEISET